LKRTIPELRQRLKEIADELREREPELSGEIFAIALETARTQGPRQARHRIRVTEAQTARIKELAAAYPAWTQQQIANRITEEDRLPIPMSGGRVSEVLAGKKQRTTHD